MTFEAFFVHFVASYVCRYNDDDVESPLVYQHSPVPTHSYFSFELKDDFNFGSWGLEILASQLRYNLKERLASKRVPAWLSIMLIQIEGGPTQRTTVDLPYHFVKASLSPTFQMHLDIEPERLSPGKYVIHIGGINEWAPQDKGFCVKILSKKPIALSKIQMPDDTPAKAVASRAFQNRTTQYNMKYPSIQGAFKVVEMHQQQLYNSIVIFNESTETIQERFDFCTLANMSVVGLEDGVSVKDYTIAPGAVKTILLKRKSALKGVVQFSSYLMKRV